MNNLKEYTEDLPVIDFTDKYDTTDMMTCCPYCGDKYLAHIPYVNIGCGKCSKTYTTDFKQSMYQKRLYKIVWIISFNAGFVIKASEKYQADIALVEKHFKSQKCYDVFDMEVSTESHKRCTECGVCNSCYQCNECHHNFSRDSNRRKTSCPKCHSDNVEKTRFIKAESLNGKHICPECKSVNVIMTRTNKMGECHICKSKKLSDKITETLFYLKVKRKKAYV